MQIWLFDFSVFFFFFFKRAKGLGAHSTPYTSNTKLSRTERNEPITTDWTLERGVRAEYPTIHRSSPTHTKLFPTHKIIFLHKETSILGFKEIDRGVKAGYPTTKIALSFINFSYFRNMLLRFSRISIPMTRKYRISPAVKHLAFIYLPRFQILLFIHVFLFLLMLKFNFAPIEFICSYHLVYKK